MSIRVLETSAECRPDPSDSFTLGFTAQSVTFDYTPRLRSFQSRPPVLILHRNTNERAGLV